MEIYDKDNLKTVQFFISQGYHLVVRVRGRGWCGVKQMLCTWGLFYNMTRESSGDGRYCFANMYQAITALATWDGVGDPPGKWIKHKGKSGEYNNPNT
jgi:hypothetical protein